MQEKSLILIRHGDAEALSCKLPGNDILRELTSFGVTKINRLSKFLLEKDFFFDKIISSSAVRTSQTAQIISKNIGYNISNIEHKESLYNCKTSNYINIIDELDKDINNLMIVGHSPVITEFGEYLVGKPIGHLQQAGIIYIALKNKGWENIHNREAKLIFAKNFLQGTLKLA
ncbi:MAG: hypothetical protein GY830_10210 [Bacteroidetes bacterium]|nr:hypothetical protein [Bacteroidota bacterium]